MNQYKRKHIELQDKAWRYNRNYFGYVLSEGQIVVLYDILEFILEYNKSTKTKRPLVDWVYLTLHHGKHNENGAIDNVKLMRV